MTEDSTKPRIGKKPIIAMIALLVIVVIAAFIITQNGDQREPFEPDLELKYGNYVLTEVTENGTTYRTAIIVLGIDGDVAEVVVADDLDKFAYTTVKMPVKEIIDSISLDVRGWDEVGTEEIILRDYNYCEATCYASSDDATASMFGDLCMSYSNAGTSYEVLATNMLDDFFDVRPLKVMDVVDGDHFSIFMEQMLWDSYITTNTTYTWHEEGTVVDTVSIDHSTGITERSSYTVEVTMEEYLGHLFIGDLSDMNIYSIQVFPTEDGYLSMSATMYSKDGTMFTTFDLETGLILEYGDYEESTYYAMTDISFVR